MARYTQVWRKFITSEANTHLWPHPDPSATLSHGHKIQARASIGLLRKKALNVALLGEPATRRGRLVRAFAHSIIRPDSKTGSISMVSGLTTLLPDLVSICRANDGASPFFRVLRFLLDPYSFSVSDIHGLVSTYMGTEPVPDEVFDYMVTDDFSSFDQEWLSKVGTYKVEGVRQRAPTLYDYELYLPKVDKTWKNSAINDDALQAARRLHNHAHPGTAQPSFRWGTPLAAQLHLWAELVAKNRRVDKTKLRSLVNSIQQYSKRNSLLAMKTTAPTPSP